MEVNNSNANNLTKSKAVFGENGFGILHMYFYMYVYIVWYVFIQCIMQ